MTVELSSPQQEQSFWQTTGLFAAQKGVFRRILYPAWGVWLVILIATAIMFAPGFGWIIASVICLGLPGIAGIFALGALWWRQLFNTLMDIPHIYADSTMLHRDMPLELDYRQHFKKDTEIVVLKAQLVLREWVRYTQGTSTYTDTREIVFDEDWIDHQPISAGQNYHHKFRLRVPADAMHTWDNASNNKLTWHIKVDLDLPGWVDYRNAYEVTVLPEVTHADV